MPNNPIRISHTVKGAHIILMGYGHWLANDPRGSGSEEVRKPELRDLGPVHLGRKRVQPPRSELKSFYRNAEPRLDHETIWFDETARSVLACGFAEVIARHNYTCYALAVLRNHLHAVLRKHRDDFETMMLNVMLGTHDALHAGSLVPQSHPVWADRPYKVYLRTQSEVLGRIAYVNQNPVKEGLSAQNWSCVTQFIQ